MCAVQHSAGGVRIVLACTCGCLAAAFRSTHTASTVFEAGESFSTAPAKSSGFEQGSGIDPQATVANKPGMYLEASSSSSWIQLASVPGAAIEGLCSFLAIDKLVQVHPRAPSCRRRGYLQASRPL